MLLDPLGGVVSHRRDGRAPVREEDKLGSLVPRIRSAFDVAGALKLFDRLGHRLFPHMSQLCEFGDGRTLQ
jgi:hypothetical protein